MIGDLTRGEFATAWWREIRDLPDVDVPGRSGPGVSDDRDGAMIANRDDALPLYADNASLPARPRPVESDGVPDELASGARGQTEVSRLFNFAGKEVSPLEGFTSDAGLPFDESRGHGWRRDISANSRRRRSLPELYRDTFLFTREVDVWECVVPDGRWQVTVCVGDSGHAQEGARVRVEDVWAIHDVATASGWFHEASVTVDVDDGRLTVELGPQQPQCNTCLNWLRIIPVE